MGFLALADIEFSCLATGQGHVNSAHFFGAPEEEKQLLQISAVDFSAALFHPLRMLRIDEVYITFLVHSFMEDS